MVVLVLVLRNYVVVLCSGIVQWVLCSGSLPLGLCRGSLPWFFAIGSLPWFFAVGLCRWFFAVGSLPLGLCGGSLPLGLCRWVIIGGLFIYSITLQPPCRIAPVHHLREYLVQKVLNKKLCKPLYNTYREMSKLSGNE